MQRQAQPVHNRMRCLLSVVFRVDLDVVVREVTGECDRARGADPEFQRDGKLFFKHRLAGRFGTDSERLASFHDLDVAEIL